MKFTKRLLIWSIYLAGALVIFSGEAQHNAISAQDNKASITCEGKAMLPPEICKKGRCLLRPRISQDGSLYILNSYKLYIARPNSITHSIIDLFQFKDTIGILPDFVPWTADSVLLFGQTQTGYKFTLFDLNTQIASRVELAPDVALNTCENKAVPLTRAFERLGNREQVIVCSGKPSDMPGRPVQMIKIVDIPTRTISDSLIEIVGTTGGVKPWNTIAGGDDGHVYLNGSRNYLEPGSKRHDNLDFVIHGAPEDSQWKAIAIPRARISLWEQDPPSALTSYHSRLIKVDDSSNMYFVTQWRDSSGQKRTDFVKINVRGNLVWKVTERDIGAGMLPLGVIDDNTFLLLGETSDEGGQLQQCNVPDNVGIPAPPTPNALRAKIAECIADPGIQTSLNARIEAGQWQPIINEVEALDSAQVTAECAGQIVEMARYFIENPAGG